MGRTIDYMHPQRRVGTRTQPVSSRCSTEKQQTGQLHIGLIHPGDGEDNRARIATVRSVMPELGIASECGWSRTEPGRLSGLLHSHRAVAEPLAD